MNIISVIGKLKVILPTVRNLATGLSVVSQALGAAIEELKQVKPDFRYLEHLWEVRKYLQKGAAILENVLAVLGAGDIVTASSVADVRDIENLRKELSKVS